MQSTRRKIRDEGEARELLSAYEEWPEGFRSFCAAEGVDGRSLRAWQRRLTPELPPPALAELACPATIPSQGRLAPLALGTPLGPGAHPVSQ